MTQIRFIITAVALAATLLPAPLPAQGTPRLHVNTRWKQCSIQLDSSLTQSAWRQFTQEAGQVVYFRPLTDARPMGRGTFEVSFMQWQTNVDDGDAAWNDTFVHPDSTHWLYEGSGLQFPGLAFRAGVTSRTDVGVYFTKNVQANYGAFGLQLQQALLAGSPGDAAVAARGSYVALFGPDDVDLAVYGIDVVGSWKEWSYDRATVTPYVALGTYLSTARENSPAVSLADERAIGVIGTVGAQLRVSMLRVAAEAGVGQVPSISMKFGVAW